MIQCLTRIHCLNIGDVVFDLHMAPKSPRPLSPLDIPRLRLVLSFVFKKLRLSNVIQHQCNTPTKYMEMIVFCVVIIHCLNIGDHVLVMSSLIYIWHLRVQDLCSLGMYLGSASYYPSYIYIFKDEMEIQCIQMNVQEAENEIV
eukprot:248400_1